MGVTFAPPRLEHFGPLVLAGRRKSHPLGRGRLAIYADVAAQWQAFAAEARVIRTLPPALGYGVGFRMSEGEVLDYFSGCVVAGPADVPAGFDVLEIPALTMAVFDHPDHVSHLNGTVQLIYATVLPMAGIEAVEEAGVPEFIERYGAAFNPATGYGGIEVLVPVTV